MPRKKKYLFHGMLCTQITVQISAATGIPVPSCGIKWDSFGSFCGCKVCDKTHAAHKMGFGY